MTENTSAQRPPPRDRDEPPAVFIAGREMTCAECRRELERDNLVHYEGEQALCLDCALLGHLVFLPSGDVALTRRASAQSRRFAVVLEWSRRRKRYERRGTLVETAALARARQECTADAEARARQRQQAAARRAVIDEAYVAAFAREVCRHFPGCPPAEAQCIARHACEKHSGRVGRAAFARALDAEAVRLAVIAHVRHAYTDYDRLRDRRVDRATARAAIKGRVDRILRGWARPLSSTCDEPACER